MKFEEVIKITDWKMMVCRALEDGPTDCTWYDQSDWVGETYSDEQIMAIMKVLYLKFKEDVESDKAGEVMDYMNIFWYAISDIDLWEPEIYKWSEELGEID